jgi:ketosteroid isomerase-like protein
MNAGDADAMLELVHPDVVWHAPPGPEGPLVFEGHEGVRQFLAGWLEAWGRFEQEVREVELHGDWRLARVMIQTRGEISGIEMEAESGYLMRVQGNLLTYMRIFMSYDAARAAWFDKNS